MERMMPRFHMETVCIMKQLIATGNTRQSGLWRKILNIRHIDSEVLLNQLDGHA